VVVLRLAGLAVAIALGALIVLYISSGERRYLRYAWRLFGITLAAVLVFLVLLALERLASLA
jgi:hypothetical protein